MQKASIKGSNKGFTLIELLVVIAIIGILAAIVLVSLGNARQRGADAGIQGNLDGIRTQAELWSTTNGNTYGAALATSTTGCATQTTGVFSDSTIQNAIAAAETASGASAACAVGPIGAHWSVAVPLKSNPAASWCVSSSGVAKQVNAVGAASLAAGAGCL